MEVLQGATHAYMPNEGFARQSVQTDNVCCFIFWGALLFPTVCAAPLFALPVNPGRAAGAGPAGRVGRIGRADRPLFVYIIIINTISSLLTLLLLLL